jgi:hypothetical protein
VNTARVTFDAATEDHIARLLADAPPLPPKALALVVRAFAGTKQTTDVIAMSDAA